MVTHFFLTASGILPSVPAALAYSCSNDVGALYERRERSMGLKPGPAVLA